MFENETCCLSLVEDHSQKLYKNVYSFMIYSFHVAWQQKIHVRMYMIKYNKMYRLTPSKTFIYNCLKYKSTY